MQLLVFACKAGFADTTCTLSEQHELTISVHIYVLVMLARHSKYLYLS